MASWVTHLMIADRVWEQHPWLDRLSFGAGSIAPDCNVENEDWTQFTPPREVTHWMAAGRKTAADSDRFFAERIEPNRMRRKEYSFWLGYWAHLVADAEFQRMIRDERRVAAAWKRVKAHPDLASRAAGMPETWDTIKMLLPKREWMKDLYTLEADYLETHPDSGYRDVMNLTSFPDYAEFLPPGAIVRKIGVMAGLPEPVEDAEFVFFTREEYADFVERTCAELICTLNGRIFT